MIGRGANRRIMVGGTGTAPPFDGILTAAAEGSGLTIRRDPSGFSPSDSLPFARARIPTLFFFACMHPDYHRSTDHYDRLDYETAKRLVDVAAGATRRIADLPERPVYAEVPSGGGGGPWLGVTLADDDGPGAVLGGVLAGSPAAQAGLIDGDRIVCVGKDTVDDSSDLVRAIGAHRSGEEVEVAFLRGGKPQTGRVRLGARGEGEEIPRPSDPKRRGARHPGTPVGRGTLTAVAESLRRAPRGRGECTVRPHERPCHA